MRQPRTRQRLRLNYVTWRTYDPNVFHAAYRSVGIILLPCTIFGMWDLSPHIPEHDTQPADIVFFNTGPGTALNHPGHADLAIGNR
jgi:cell wall-associated NlpC family hydrolase